MKEEIEEQRRINRNTYKNDFVWSETNTYDKQNRLILNFSFSESA